MARISLPGPEEMNEDQLEVYRSVVSGPRGRMVGPLRAVIHSPELARRWSDFGEFLRYATCLPRKLNELAIIIVGRRWNSQLEFQIHAKAALEAGLGANVIEAIRLAEPPAFEEESEQVIYEFTRHLLETGDTPDAVHAAVAALFGERGAVELVGVIGYYTMVSMTLNAHGIPLPEGAAPPLPVPTPGSLTSLPPSQRILRKTG
jgi:4-carboxymuconolactone decarboxylase